jgi:hypothetical protein
VKDQVIAQRIQWAGHRDSIRAMLLTSTRAIPDAPLDISSDYDGVLVVKNIHPFYEDRSWLEDFGEVLVVCANPISVFALNGCLFLSLMDCRPTSDHFR